MNDHDGNATGLRISITPEPTDEEIAAVAAVVTALAVSSPAASEPERDPVINRWSLAARQEALRGPYWPPDGVSSTEH